MCSDPVFRLVHQPGELYFSIQDSARTTFSLISSANWVLPVFPPEAQRRSRHSVCPLIPHDLKGEIKKEISTYNTIYKYNMLIIQHLKLNRLRFKYQLCHLLGGGRFGANFNTCLSIFIFPFIKHWPHGVIVTIKWYIV